MIIHKRPRILRHSRGIRSMVAETKLSVDNLVAPLFIQEGENIKVEMKGLLGHSRFSIDLVLEEVKLLSSLGINAVLLFAKCEDALKDNLGTEAIKADGLMQRAVRAIKSSFPEMIIMTDVALDPYSIYGHDGIVRDKQILNDETIAVLAQMALSHAAAGADFVAPSDMMDGRVSVIRETLEQHGFNHTGIMAYSAKYASALYGPFREALDSAPGFGDKKSYQMDYRNRIEAIKEALLDEKEGADLIMVKPAMTYLDVIREIKNTVMQPVCAYHVSGEYMMIKAAALAGFVNESELMMESTYAMKRAGADLVITYFAKEIAKNLNEQL